MAKIYAPNKSYSGVSAGVRFVNGVGETDDPHLLDWFRRRGYKVEAARATTKGNVGGKDARQAKKPEAKAAEAKAGATEQAAEAAAAASGSEDSADAAEAQQPDE